MLSATPSGRVLPDQRVLLPRASGFCCMCDSLFRNRPAIAWPDPRAAGGWRYIETRHLDLQPDHLRDQPVVPNR